jgi:hypothetical protein
MPDDRTIAEENELEALMTPGERQLFEKYQAFPTAVH